MPRSRLAPPLLGLAALSLLAACGQVAPPADVPLSPTAGPAFYYDRSWGSQGAAEGQFGSIYEVAVGDDGSVFVMDTGNNRVQVFDREGIFRQSWPLPNGDAYNFALDQLNNVYLANERYGRIDKVAEDGTFLASFLSDDAASDVAVGAEGAIYATGYGQVRKLAPDGTELQQWTIGEGSGYSRSIAVEDGFVYVASENFWSGYKMTIYKYTMGGELVTSWAGATTPGELGTVTVTGLAVEGEYVYLAGESSISIFDLSGSRVTTLGKHGRGGVRFGRVGGVGAAGGELFVTDRANYRVQVLADTTDRAPQSVAFTSSAPTDARVGGDYVPTAEATSGLAVDITVTSNAPDVCDFSSNEVAFINEGTCTLTASQIGDDIFAAADPVEQSFTVADAPVFAVADSYLVDFENAPANKVIYSVKTGAGVVHLSGNAPKVATVPVVAKRSSGKTVLQAQVAKVASAYGSKRLVASSQSGNAPAAQGGRVKLSFTNFDPEGVTLASLTLSNLTAKGATLSVLYADGTSAKQLLGTTAPGGSLVVPLGIKGVAAVDVSAPNAFAVDDVRFIDEADVQ